MAYVLTEADMNTVLKALTERYRVYAPRRFQGDGTFSDTDTIRYGELSGATTESMIRAIVFDRKSDYSFKEALFPIGETLFYFTEGETKTAEPAEKPPLIFLRSCELHALKRLDEIFLNNGMYDYYYKRARETARFALLPCKTAFANCRCVDFGANIAAAQDYSLALEADGDKYILYHGGAPCLGGTSDCLMKRLSPPEIEREPSFVKETTEHVSLPKTIPDSPLLSAKIAASPMWNDYDGRCVNCGRCNFVCPTCTCWTMQDIFYSENGRAGERRRVWASCMVDGYTDVAGGGSYRKKNGERMRFKTMHKIVDYRRRFGAPMCVGCGRCEDICPEYISYFACVNKLTKEVENNG